MKPVPRAVHLEGAAEQSARRTSEFERIFLPHLDAAYNLARLLIRNPEDAEDVVQESYLKALRAFSSFRGEASRPWFLTIVRNTSFTWLRDNRGRADRSEINQDIYNSGASSPEAQALCGERKRMVEDCIQRLPSDFREAIVLREIAEMSYREIAKTTGVPPGTVMSRLSRARARLAECLRASRSRSLFQIESRP